MSYAIVRVGGKQYRVSEGQKLLVDRLAEAEGAMVTLDTLLVWGDGSADLAPTDVAVTARVVGHVLGEKVRIGKYRPKTGYRRHTGYRSRLSQIQIEAIGKRSSRSRSRKSKESPAGSETEG